MDFTGRGKKSKYVSCSVEQIYFTLREATKKEKYPSDLFSNKTTLVQNNNKNETNGTKKPLFSLLHNPNSGCWGKQEAISEGEFYLAALATIWAIRKNKHKQ